MRPPSSDHVPVDPQFITLLTTLTLSCGNKQRSSGTVLTTQIVGIVVVDTTAVDAVAASSGAGAKARLTVRDACNSLRQVSQLSRY